MKPTRAEFLSDIIVAAYESGAVTYWAKTSAYKWRDVPKKSLNLVWAEFTLETEEGRIVRVTPRFVSTAIKNFLASDTLEIRQDIWSGVAWADKYNDAIDIDSEIADAIIQFGVFGDVIYG